jgi:hypothetical protein
MDKQVNMAGKGTSEETYETRLNFLFYYIVLFCIRSPYKKYIMEECCVCSLSVTSKRTLQRP